MKRRRIILTISDYGERANAAAAPLLDLINDPTAYGKNPAMPALIDIDREPAETDGSIQ